MENSRRAQAVGEPSLVDHRSSRPSTQEEAPQMEVNEPPIINVDEPPVVDVDDGDDEVADNKGGGHKKSWVWRHFDQEAVKKGAKIVKCPYCGIMMCANVKKNGTSAMGT